MAPLWDWPANLSGGPHAEGKVYTLPLLAIGNTDQVVVWDQAFTGTTYAIDPSIQTGTASVGLVMPVVKAGTITTTGCTITLVNTGLVSISAGSTLHVIAYGQ